MRTEERTRATATRPSPSTGLGLGLEEGTDPWSHPADRDPAHQPSGGQGVFRGGGNAIVGCEAL